MPPPAPRTVPIVKQALKRLHRTLLIKAFFLDDTKRRQNTPYDPVLRVPPSSWTPPLPPSGPLSEPSWKYYEDHILLACDPYYNPLPVTKNPEQGAETDTRPIPSRLHRAITGLKHKYPALEFRQTDKNLGLAILTKTAYQDMVMRHLNDKTTYEVHEGGKERLVRQINARMLTLKYRVTPHLTPQEEKHLNHNWQHRIPFFHCLPKIHKPGPIQGRPIVGAVNWYTTPSSKILDRRLQPLLATQTSVIVSSSQLLQVLQTDTLPKHQRLLVTMDVTSLYTNIRLETLRKILAESTDPTLVHLLDFVTNNNYFQFDETIYRQKEGIAMGTNAAVQLANLYLAKLLDPHIRSYPSVSTYARYIDDIFLLFDGNEQELGDLEAFANTLIPGIKLTMAYSAKSIPFLDVLITLDNFGALHTSLYRKPMNRFLYIPYHTCHPQATLRGYIYGELLRFKRICSTKDAFSEAALHFYGCLLTRNYPRSFLTPIFAATTWDTKPDKTPVSEDKYTQLILPHTHQNAGPINHAVYVARTLFLQATGTIIRCAFTNGPSLGRLLTSSRFTPEKDPKQADRDPRLSPGPKI